MSNGQQIRKWGRRSLVGYLVLVVCAAFAVEVRQHDVDRIARDERALQMSRRQATFQTCMEANERHRIAAVGLGALAAKTSPKNPTLAEAKRRKMVLAAFVDALAPAYLAGAPGLPLADRERLGCDARVRLLNH